MDLISSPGKVYICLFLLSLVFSSDGTLLHLLHMHHQHHMMMHPMIHHHTMHHHMMMHPTMQPNPTCNPNCCADKNCPPAHKMQCHPSQKMKHHAGWCGCCPECMTQLKEGDRCQANPKHPSPNMPSSECGCGMKCVHGKCCKQ